jgi:formiminoglutamate deiminase
LIEARPSGPLHIHAAERVEEVAEIEATLGARPVEWLLNELGVGERWCLIHATHLTELERDRLAASGAVAGVCPLTEANLADGKFPLAEFRHRGGRIAIGTDANHLIDLPGELRMLEYGQRLSSMRRETLLLSGEHSAARTLVELVGSGGAQAVGQPVGAIRPGLRCDLVELNADHPAFLGQEPETALDAWIFSSASEHVVRTVIVAGRTVVDEGRHPAELQARRDVDRVMRQISQRH